MLTGVQHFKCYKNISFCCGLCWFYCWYCCCSCWCEQIKFWYNIYTCFSVQCWYVSCHPMKWSMVRQWAVVYIRVMATPRLTSRVIREDTRPVTPPEIQLLFCYLLNALNQTKVWYLPIVVSKHNVNTCHIMVVFQIK